MNRRFLATLLTAAFVVAGSTAYAIAPTINSIASPVISDDEAATGSGVFVYPDAMNLDNMASDPDDTVTSPGQIIWSYYGEAGRIRINDVDPLNLDGGGDDPVNPTGKTLSSNTDPADDDGSARTITFRDSVLSPVGGPNTDPSSETEPGILHTEVLTLFASDGTTYSMRSFMAYVENDGTDRLSTSLTPVETIVPSSSGANAWTSSGFGSLQFSDSGSGLCIQSTLANSDDAFGGWRSPYGMIELTAFTAYRLRLTMDSPAAIPEGQTPFWDLLIENNNADVTAGDLKYNADYMVWDNQGGANAIGLGASGRTEFDIWFTPAPVTAADWNDATSGMFTAERDPDNDMALQFRVFDTNTGNAIVGSTDGGTICLNQIQVDSVNINDLGVEQTVYNSGLTDADFAAYGLVGGATSVQFAGGDVTVAPTAQAGAWESDIVFIDMGDPQNLSDAASYEAAYPLPWESDTLLMGTMSATAPSQTAETNPPDGISVGFDVGTNELLYDNMVVASVDTVGLPKVGVTTDYKALFYTHNASNTETAYLAGARIRGKVLLSPDIGRPTTGTNDGGVTFTNVRVDQVALP